MATPMTLTVLTMRVCPMSCVPLLKGRVPPLEGRVRNRLLLGRWQARGHPGTAVAVAETLRIPPAMLTSSHTPAPALAKAMALEAPKLAPKGGCVYDTPAAAKAAAVVAVAVAALQAATAVAAVKVVAVAVAAMEEVVERGT